LTSPFDMGGLECPHDPSLYCFPLAARSMTGEQVQISGTHPETGETTEGITEITQEMIEAWQVDEYCP